MQMTCLREGANSAAMQSAEDTARKLLSSVEPAGAGDEGAREMLNKEVRVAFADGLSLLGMHAEQGAPLLVRLKQLQQTMLLETNVQPQDGETAQLPASGAGAITDNALVQPGNHSSESVGVQASVPEVPEPITPPQTIVDVEKATVSSPVVAAPEPQRKQPARPRLPVMEVREPIMKEVAVQGEGPAAEDLDPRASAWVEQLHTGSWFEYQPDTQAPTQRCKLAAVISFSGKYIFVNRGGMKVAEFSRLELTRHHAQGLIRLLNDNQLFDRALESVIGNLRQLQSGRNA